MSEFSIQVDEGAVDSLLETVDLDSQEQYFRSLRASQPLNSELLAELAKSVEVGVLAEERMLTRAEDLTQDEIDDLAELKRVGEQAFGEIFEANRKLVVWRAKKFFSKQLDLMDKIQEGNEGLVHAIEMFDYKLGYTFSTYAVKWIDQKIRKAIQDKDSTIRMPAHFRQNVGKVSEAFRDLEQETGRAPSIEDIAHKMGVNVSEVKKVLLLIPSIVSLDKPVGAGPDSAGEELGDFIVDTESADPSYNDDRSDIVSRLYRCLEELEEPEVRIIAARYNLDGQGGASLEEAASSAGVASHQVAGHLASKAFSKLRHPSLGVNSLFDDVDWRISARCAEVGLSEFFPTRGGTAKPAKSVCANCEVRESCLDYALDNDDRFGIWGGLSERERRKLKGRSA